MKLILKISCVFFIFTAFIACNDGFDTTYSTLDIPEKGTVVTYSAVQTGFYDFSDLDNASIGFSVDAFGEAASSIIVYKSYNKGPLVKHADINTIPSSITIPFADAINGTTILKENVALGDRIVFTFAAVTPSGTYNSKNSLTVDVSCKSDIGGNYTAETTGQSTDGCCPDPVSLTSNVTLVDLGGGSYTISDFSAGLYFEWYDEYGITEGNQKDGTLDGKIIEICSDISGTFPEIYGTDVNVTGGVDPTTGIITYTWKNGYDDNGTVILTPN